MAYRPFFPRIVTRYVCLRFFKLLLFCLCALSTIYLLVEFFERIDNLMAQNLSIWVMFQYLSYRLPQVIFQILPVAVLMGILLILGGMAKDGELIALLAGGINIYQITLPLLIICLLLSVLSGFYQESFAPGLNQESAIRLAQIKGERIQKKLPQGRMWLAGKQGRFFHLQILDADSQSLTGVTVFEVDDNFQLKKRWDIQKCFYRSGLWHLHNGQIWDFEKGMPELENIQYKIVAWPEEFQDFARIQKDPSEMKYKELRQYVQKLEEWGYDARIQKTDLYFKWAFPLTCFIFGLLGIPFAIRLHRGVKYLSLGLALGISFIYWIIMYVGVSMSHSGMLPPVLGAWAGNILFRLFGGVLMFLIRT